MESNNKLEEAEIWKIRAMVSEKKSILAEIALLKMKFEQLDNETKLFDAVLKEKYKCKNGDHIDGEGYVIRETINTKAETEAGE